MVRTLLILLEQTICLNMSITLMPSSKGARDIVFPRKDFLSKYLTIKDEKKKKTSRNIWKSLVKQYRYRFGMQLIIINAIPDLVQIIEW